MARIRLFGLMLLLVCLPDSGHAQESPRALSLADVFALVEERSPLLEAARWQVRAADGRAEQAGLFLNPELDVEVENFAGTGVAKGIGGAETTVALGQTIELGGKRSGRSDVARHESDAVRLDAEQQRLDVLARATRLFIAGLAAQERSRLEDEAASLARETEVAVRRRVEAGRSPPAEALRAKVARARADVRLGRAKREVIVAYGELASLWQGEASGIESLTGTLTDLPAPPGEELLAQAVANSPRIAASESKVSAAEAALDLAGVQGMPDPTLSVGYRRMNDSNGHAMVAGLSLPLPVFDRNQGAAAAARAELEQASAELTGERTRLLAEVKATLARLDAAREEALMLKDEILPAAEEALKETQLGYQRGLFSLLNVLSAQQSLFDVRRDFLETAAHAHELRADLGALLGRKPAKEQTP